MIAEPDADTCSDAEWTDYLFMDDNRSDVVREWWFHVPTAYWFIAERDRGSDEILRSYAP